MIPRIGSRFSELGQIDAALTELDPMLSAPGFYNIVWVEHDPGFARVRADKRFHTFQSKFRQSQ
jgi:surface antigen